MPGQHRQLWQSCAAEGLTLRSSILKRHIAKCLQQALIVQTRTTTLCSRPHCALRPTVVVPCYTLAVELEKVMPAIH